MPAIDPSAKPDATIEGKPSKVEQSEKDRKMAEGLEKLFAEAVSARSTATKKWQEHLKIFVGDQLIDGRPGFKSNTVTNYIFPQVEQNVAHLSARPPEVSVENQVEDLGGRWKQWSDDMEAMINRVIRRGHPSRVVRELVTYMEVYGPSIIKATFDKNARSGKGDIVYGAIDPMTFFHEPGQSPEDSNFVCEAKEVRQVSMFRMYPDKRTEIDELFRDKNDKSDANHNRAQASGDFASNSGRTVAIDGAAEATGTVPYLVDTAMKSGESKSTILLKEIYFHDEEMVDEFIEIMDVATKKSKRSKRQVPKYPNGRMIVFAEGVIFEDKANPFPEFPYICGQNYFIPGNNQSMSEIEQMWPIQQQINVRKNQVNDFFNYNLSPIRIVDTRSGIEKGQISNRPNLWLWAKDPKNAVHELRPPPLTSGIFESIFTMKQDIETVSLGSKEVTRGEAPNQVRSGAAVDSLIEEARVGSRMKTREIESMFADLGRFIVKLMEQSYVKGIHYYEDVDFKDENYSIDLFEFTVKAGVNLPNSRFAKQQLIQWMFERDMIPPEYILDHLDLEDKRALMKKMQPLFDAQAAAKLAIAEQAAQPQPQGGPA